MSIDVSTQKKLDYKCARLVIFSGLANELSEFTDEKGNITKIIADDYIIEVGKTVKAGKKVFKVNYIKQHKLREDRGLYVFNYDLMFDKLNQCTTFMLPMLFFNDKNITSSRETMWFGSHFVNAYVNVEGASTNEIGDSIYLLYRYSTSKEFMKFDAEMQSRHDFISCIPTDKYHILYQFKTPDEFREEYSLFIQGKLSQFSNDYKKIIRLFHHVTSGQKVYRVLYRDPKLKKEIEEDLEVSIPEDQELSEFPDIHGNLTFRDHLIISNSQESLFN